MVKNTNNRNIVSNVEKANETIKLFDAWTEVNNGKLCVNLTRMAKEFGKNLTEWLRLPSTQEYIQAYESLKGGKIPPYEQKVGKGGGTWSNDNSFTVSFARYCDPYFALLCDEIIARKMQEIQTDAVSIITRLFGGKIDLTDATQFQLVALNCPQLNLPAHIAETHYTATEFGNKFLGLTGSCGRVVNQLLSGLGLLEQLVRKGKKKWKITQAGSKYLTEVIGTDGIHKQVCIIHNMANELKDLIHNKKQ